MDTEKKCEVNANSVESDKLRFTIEDNILKGEVTPHSSPYRNFGKALYDTLKKNPSVIGQLDVLTDATATYEDIVDRSIKCALWMIKQGVKYGDVIGVSTHNHMNSCIPCIACLFIGATFNPWDHTSDKEMVSYFLKLSGAKIVFANEQAAEVIIEAAKRDQRNVKVVVFGRDPAAIPFSQVLQGHHESEVANFECADVAGGKDTAMILCSSGTTGLPKGVQLSHDCLIRNIEICEYLKLSGQIPLWFSSLSWITGVLFTLECIVHRTQIILYPAFDEETTCKLIQKYGVTWLFLGTSMANRLIKSDHLAKYDLSSLKTLFTGGALLKSEAQEEIKKNLPNVSVLQAYGMTEVGGIATIQTASSPNGSVGVIYANVEIKISDPNTGKTLTARQRGEICIKAPTMTTGYYKNPEATKATIDSEGWLHSGDLGYYDEAGELFVVDRLKELIKYRGYHVTPGLIENVLQSHPAVQEAAVIAVSHPTDDEHPLAFVSRVPTKEVTAQELIDLVAANLMDSHHLRGGVIFLPSLPYTASGKVSKKDLRKMVKTA